MNDTILYIQSDDFLESKQPTLNLHFTHAATSILAISNGASVISMNSQSTDGTPNDLLCSSVRASAATSVAIYRLLQHDLVWSRDRLAFGLCKAGRASVCRVWRVKLVNDGVDHHGLFVYGYSGVGRDSHPVVWFEVSVSSELCDSSPFLR